MTANHVLIQNITLNASASSVTFSSIPQTGYTDLIVKISARDASTASYANDLNININGSSASITGRTLYGTGSGVGSNTGALWIGNVPANSATASTFGNTELYFPNYNSTTTYKSFSVDGVTENNATNALAHLYAGLYSSNTAISSLTFLLYGGTSFTAGSSFSLYGVAAVGTTPTVVPKASGGDIIKNDGTYWYHAFLSSGTFVPQTNLTADVLVIAGGGGGAGQNTAAGGSGGGGAGGLLGFTSQSLTGSTSYTCTVGAGGAGGGPSSNGTVGADSQFAALTLVKGGGYGAKGGSGSAGGNGGSGGGGAYGGTSGGSATSGQGNAGGNGTTYQWSGGGGGAGAAGSSQTPGVGSSSYSSWGSATGLGQNVSSTYYFAGGGAGGGGNASVTGANGGGGASGTSGTATSGTPNTGGGGGGGGDSYYYGNTTGGNGGSGVIIIKYAMV